MTLAVLYNVSLLDAQYGFEMAGFRDGAISGSLLANNANATNNATIAVLPPLRWSGDDGDFFGSFWRLCCASSWTTWCFMNSTMFLLFISHLFYSEVHAVLVNLTRNEMINMKRYENFVDPISGKFKNPFDKGSWWKNMVDRIFIIRRSNCDGKAVDWKKIYSLEEYRGLSKKRD